MRFVAGLLLLAAGVSAQTADPVLAALNTRIKGFDGVVTLYAKNLDTGKSVAIRDSEAVRTASTIKIAIMASVFDAVEHGDAKWTDLLTVTAGEKVSGSGIIASEISNGVQLPVQDVLHLMMVLSDNTATNMILERFTAERVNRYLDGIGIKTTRSMRKIMSGPDQVVGWSEAGKLPANKKYGLGVSTPRDMVTLLEKLDRGELVNAAASKEMLAIMKRCRDESSIRRHMGDTEIANKTGALDALRADVGIVYAKSGRVAMAIYVDGMPKVDYSLDNVGAQLIADLAKILVEGLKN
jgi:beta-lactamase class A